MEKHIPKKTIWRKPDIPWMTREIKRMIKKKTMQNVCTNKQGNMIKTASKKYYLKNTEEQSEIISIVHIKQHSGPRKRHNIKKILEIHQGQETRYDEYWNTENRRQNSGNTKHPQRPIHFSVHI